jgi:tellurite resistance protein TerC
VNDGRAAVVKYLTGYVVEKSLSVDNVFVIAMLFGFFAVPALYQHRVLFWGILGALALRGLMIGIGRAPDRRVRWILYVFGAFLIVTAVKMLVMKTDHADPNANVVVRLTRRFFPVTERFHGEHFLVRAGTATLGGRGPGCARRSRTPRSSARRAGALMLTPLALALVMVETTDLVFAVDSIPAIFAITADPFLVFTSNVFAILGLRSLYFALAGAIESFRYLKVSLAVVLAVVGAKMLAALLARGPARAAFNLYLLAAVLLILQRARGVVLIPASRRGASSGDRRDALSSAHGSFHPI